METEVNCSVESSSHVYIVVTPSAMYLPYFIRVFTDHLTALDYKDNSKETTSETYIIYETLNTTEINPYSK